MERYVNSLLGNGKGTSSECGDFWNVRGPHKGVWGTLSLRKKLLNIITRVTHSHARTPAQFSFSDSGKVPVVRRQGGQAKAMTLKSELRKWLQWHAQAAMDKCHRLWLTRERTASQFRRLGVHRQGIHWAVFS